MSNVDAVRRSYEAFARDDLDEAALMRILLEPKNAIVKQYQKYFEL